MTRAVPRILILALLCPLLGASACDREADAGAEGAAPAAAPSATATPGAEAADSLSGNRPDEIYFDLTRYGWYREARPLVHEGRPYLPQSDPTLVDLELEEAGTYEGVTYYVARDAAEPVYTIYVPVYYRYWQRFTSPPAGT